MDLKHECVIISLVLTIILQLSNAITLPNRTEDTPIGELLKSKR